MIAQPSVGNYLKGLIRYNEEKVAINEAKLLYANNVLGTVKSFEHQYFTLVGFRENKNTLLHVSLNFHEQDRELLTEDLLLKITGEFITGSGIPADHPYLVYQHFDKGHPHVHVAIPLFQDNGETIDTHKIITKKYMQLCRDIEQKYGLTHAVKREQGISLAEGQEYGTALQAIEAAMRKAMKKRPDSLDELEKYLLREPVIYNGDRVTVGAELSKKHKGITFYLQELKGEEPERFKERSFEQVGRGIRGSKVPGNYGYQKLTAQFDQNLEMRKKRRHTLEKAITETIQSSAKYGFNQFNATLERTGIKPTYFFGKENQIYGVEFTDNQTGAVFKGSDVKYSWSKIKSHFSELPQMPKAKEPLQMQGQMGVMQPEPKNFTIKIPLYEALTLHMAAIDGVTVSDIDGSDMKELKVNVNELLDSLAQRPDLAVDLAQLFEFKGSNQNHDDLVTFISGKQFMDTGIHIAEPIVEESITTQKQQVQKRKQTTMLNSTDLKERIDIVDLAQSLDYEIDKEESTAKHVKLRRGVDTIVCYKKNSSIYNRFFTPGNRDKPGLTIIDLLVDGGFVADVSAAIKYLNKEEGIIINEPAIVLPVTEKKPFRPIKATEPITANDYLTRFQGLKISDLKDTGIASLSHDQLIHELTILYGPEFARKFAGEEKGARYNVFPIYDIADPQKVIGQEVANKGFKHFVKNTAKEYGAWFKIIPAATGTIICESPAKALAAIALHRDKTIQPFATLGTPSALVINHLALRIVDGENLILGGDNDVNGQLFNFNIVTEVAKLSKNVNFTAYLSAKGFVLSLSIENTTPEELEKFKRLMKKVAPQLNGHIEENNLKLELILPMKQNSKELIDAQRITLLLSEFLYFYEIKTHVIKSKLKDFNDDLNQKNTFRQQL